ncbi:DUF4252 domain-containing protein [Hanstruepera neustonica]|uniref:DUF4252 domain-containing protein n=1 Tax=Hanstruepera neustonica TaxID=1445657 RepID=A0A2K1DWM5_9FLAO|nr:DUF4252 domain-containing protein [Hanstruepera neustonica]PNQ72422.1 DUF4252 domain-containing protein [Hanstruepera neustonica]
MKTSIKTILFGLLALSMLVSCNNGPSLQTYFVDNQESADFITADIPTSLVTLQEDSLTESQKKAFKSLKRLNFLGYKKNENNVDIYNSELSKVKSILKDKKYIDLMEFSDKAMKFDIKYIGDDDSADEVVVFVNSPDMGFGIVRVLGDDMRPENMATLVDALQKADFDESQLNGITDFFK